MSTRQEIEAAIEAWSQGDKLQPLHEFLGWSAEDYTRWYLTKVPPEKDIQWATP